MDVLLVGEVYVAEADPFLYLNTYWDIEDYWDYGFVQVSTDDGATWTSLENAYTTSLHDPAAHPNIVDNLPGITEYVGAVLDISFDLSAYVNQDVLIGFRYMTDWATVYEGWYIFDANVGGVALDLAPSYPPAEFMVTLVAFTDDRFEIIDLDLNEMNYYLGSLIREDWDSVVLIVSVIHDQGFSDYKFGVTLGLHSRYHFQ